MFGGPVTPQARQHHALAVPSGAAAEQHLHPASQGQGGQLFADLNSSSYSPTIPASSFLTPSTQPQFSHHGAADDQVRYDRAWHTVTSRLVLPSSVTAEDSFGTLPPESQFHSQDEEAEFYASLRVVLHPRTHVPRAMHTEDLLSWHTQQVRRNFVQHTVPLLSALTGPSGINSQADDKARSTYEHHIVIVEGSIQTLEAALRQYFFCLSLIIRGLEPLNHGIDSNSQQNNELQDIPPSAEVVVNRFRRDIYALVSNSASPSLMASLHAVLVSLVAKILQMPSPSPNEGQGAGSNSKERLDDRRARSDSVVADAARKRLLQLVDSLYKVGLAGERFQVLFAEVMDQMMLEFIKRSYKRVWKTLDKKAQQSERLDKTAVKSLDLSTTSLCIVSLCNWVEDHFARLAFEVLIGIEGAGLMQGKGGVSLSDVKKWKEIAVSRLASLRISELFDIVLAWPDSKGGLDDLRASVTTPEKRRQLTDFFSSALKKRLLHPGCSTLEILQVYISMIRTFHALDHSKVLLSRVVTALQLYLCQRDDAVRIVVTGLLASPDEVKQYQQRHIPEPGSSTNSGASHVSGDGKLVELAVLLNDPAQQRRVHVDEEELDWDDMEWMPDPVDAGVNYKRPKNEDVIGTLINALGSQDVFIKEFQNIIAERLLATQGNFDQEIKVLNLLKKRFGDGALQNCDVMIKDIFDSRRVDAVIRKTHLGQPVQPPRQFGPPLTPPAYQQMGHQLDADEAKLHLVPYQARILSRLYWPNIVQDTFLLPNPVVQQQQKYEQGYERLKTSRKLTWLDHLGQVSVELDLADRTVSVQCKTYEAAVIYAFQGPDTADDPDVPAVRRTTDELQETLRMDEELVFQATEFWVSKGILSHVSSEPDTYIVIERQETVQAARPPLHPAASAPAALEGDSPRKPPLQRPGTTGAMDAKERERRAVYWQFIVGMLTNSSPTMPLFQIAMMMKMLIAEGFPWSNEELQDFLGEKIQSGELELAGGKYKLVKK